MAWAGSVTDRGTANSTGSASADISAFIGTADSLICLAVFTDGADLLASNISGHDAGGGWTQIAKIEGTTDTRDLLLFAAHEGSSPSSEALIVNADDSYIGKLGVQAFEITDVKVDGTVAVSFGTPDTDEEYPGNPAAIALTTAAHANTEGLTVICGLSWSGGSTHTCTGYTLAQTDPGAYATLSFAYISGEDTSQTIGMTQYTQHLAIMVEVVGAAGGASPVSGSGNPSTPLPTLSGSGDVDNPADVYDVGGPVDLTLPLLELDGSGTSAEAFGSGNPSTPLPTLAGAGLVGAVGSGSLVTPLPVLSGIGVIAEGVSGSGALVLPIPQLSGTDGGSSGANLGSAALGGASLSG